MEASASFVGARIIGEHGAGKTRLLREFLEPLVDERVVRVFALPSQRHRKEMVRAAVAIRDENHPRPVRGDHPASVGERIGRDVVLGLRLDVRPILSQCKNAVVINRCDDVLCRLHHLT
jgi:hypothetical protein